MSSDTEIVSMLVSAHPDACRDGLVKLRECAASDSARAVRLVQAAVSEMSSHLGLPNRLQAERFRSMLRNIVLDERAIDLILANSVALTSGLLNELSAALPPSHRRRLTAAEPTVVEPSGGTDQQVRDVPSTSPERAPPPSVSCGPGIESDGGRSESGLGDDESSECSVVLLLSKQDNQDANKALLDGRGLRSIRYDSMDKLMQELAESSDICACVVDGSFLCEISADGQGDLFEAIGKYSTFIWIRVEDVHLKLSHEVIRARIRSVRQERMPLSAEALSIQGDGRLRETELGEILQAREWLRSHRKTRFSFDSLKDADLKVLSAALRQYFYQKGGPREAAIEAARLHFFSAGKSGATTVLVRSGSHQIVAKLDRKSEVLEEMGRFRTFIMGWDDRLFPMAYLHGNVGVIVFSLVDSMRQRDLPAPMLAEVLEAMWNDEVFTSDGGFQRQMRIGDLKQALEDATRRLCDLNRRVPPMSRYVDYSDLGMRQLEQLEMHGVSWGLGEHVRCARKVAEQQYARLARSAVVHGDLHLQNILIRGGREAFLVDYRASGVGHPAIDLVRLELALYLDFFRPTDTDSMCHELQRALVAGEGFKSVSERFSGLLRPAINELCVYGCVLARDRAIEAVVAHGGTVDDYLATKCLVAWQRLLLWRTQTSLTRQIITTLAEANAQRGVVGVGVRTPVV